MKYLKILALAELLVALNGLLQPRTSFGQSELSLASPLVVTLDQTQMRAAAGVVYLGRIPSTEPVIVRLKIRSESENFRTISAISLDSRLGVSWERDDSPSKTTMSFVPRGEDDLIVVIRGASELNGDPLLLVLSDNGAVVNYISVLYNLYPRTISREVHTPELAGGVGDEWGPEYKIGSGPAPLGYRVAGEHFEVVGNDRGCTKWVRCPPSELTPQGEVIHKFQVQGRPSNGVSGKQYVNVVATLTVEYELIVERPALFDADGFSESLKPSKK